jgi:hypothetical protein
MNRILTQLTKGILTTLLVICCGYLTQAQSLLTQDFNFTGSLTSNGWTAHSGTTNFIATTTGLSYTGHAGSGVGNAALVNNLGGEDVNIGFSIQNTNGQSIYYSFLLNVTETANRTGDYFIHFGNTPGAGFQSFAAKFYVRTTATGVNFGITNTTTPTYSATNFLRNTIYLIVVKYTINTGGNDPISLFVFPSGMPSTEPLTPELVNSTTIVTGGDIVSGIGLRQGSATTSIQAVVDAIRVGTTWADVVPVFNPAPIVTTNAATSISTTGATLNGLVNANGTSTDVTFDYGTSSAYGTSLAGTPSPVTGTTATSVSLSIPPGTLSPNTQYNFRVVGTSTSGTTNGSNLTFFTLAEAPAAPTVNTPTSTTLTVTLGADINPAATQYAIQETSTSNYVQANGTLASTPVWQTTAQWTSNVVVGGLAPTTTYTFQVKARNGDNVETAFSSSASGTTLVNTDPLITITGSLSPFQTYAGTATFSKNYSVSAVFLTDDLVITAPALFQISTDTSVSWNTSLSITPSSGTISSTIIYVRFNPTVAGTPSGSITHVATGANNPSLAISGVAIDFSPSVQSAITLSGITNDSISVSLAGGNGTSRIVVASTSPVTYVPVDGAAQTGVNANFSLAADKGGNNRVVYDSTGNTFMLKGLDATTTYYLASYEYNGSGVTSNYYVVDPGTASGTTYLDPPTTAAALSVRMKLDTLNLVFTPAVGSGARRLVVVSEGAGVTLTPTFGQTFTGVNSVFSSAADQGSNNRIVYDGTGTTVTVTGIQRNTLYGIKVIEYNGTGAATSYFITSGATTTLTSADFQPYLAGTTYTQDFNTLPTSGTFSTTGFGVGPYWLIGPPVNATATRGWQFAHAGTGDVVFRADSGSSNSGAIMSYGSTNTSTDRALGFLVSGTFVGTAGITFQNTSAVPLYTVSIGFDGEQYRYGGSTNLNQYKIQYALASNGILSGTWIEVPSLTYSGTSGSAGAVNGNLSPTAISGSFDISSSWLPGQLLTIRVLDLNDPGADDGLAIDNFTFSAAPAAAPTEQDSAITFSSILTTSMDVNWLNGNGAARIVVINKTNSFTNPVDGNNPLANNVYSGSGEQVVYNGTGSTVNVSGLTADSTYYARVFAYNGTGLSQVYATQTATGNPASQQTASANPPRLLKVLSINGGNAVLVNTPFSVTIQAIDSLNNPQNVNVNTTISLSTLVGSGILSGTTSAVMTSGTNSVTVSGMLYDTPEFGVQLLVEATAGATLGDTFTVAFDVYDVASSIDFEFPPTSAVVGTNAAAINVKAYRSDFSFDNFYTSNVTLSKVSGPGTLTGTLTKAAVAGQASFTDIQFSAPGTYVVKATSGLLTSTSNMTILVTLPAVMNEVAIPQYFGSKTTATTNTNRTPVVACVSFDNLLPATAYNLTAGLGLTSETATSMGAGSLWNGTAYALTGISNAFTTDATGSSGPVWISIQPSGNGTRFGAGEVHNLRVALSTTPFGTGVVPQFISTATLTALDIPTTQYDAVAANDGAFLVARADSCFSGKFALAYSNDAGTGRPLSISGVVSAFYTNGTQSQLPGSVDSVFNNTALKGSFAFVIPTGANNPDGVRYIGLRNSANQLINSISDADGIWSSGANTTTATRRQVVTLSASEASMNTLTSLSITNTTNVTCFGGNNGTAQAAATSLTPTINYTWSPSGGNAALASNLTAGTYTVLAMDTNGCARSASATITQPALFPISVSNDGPDCIGDSIQLSATGGVSYAWTGPAGFASTDQNPLLTNIVATNSGFYKVVITDAVGCTRTDSTSVFVLNCNCVPAVLTASIVNACNNTATGSIDLIVTGGVAPYTYSWSNGATTEDISGLLPGTYVVNVTDGVACIAQETFVVGNIGIPVITPSGATTFCAGGSVDLTASSGNTYEWSTGATTQTITASTAGVYLVTVTTGTCVLTSAPTSVVINSFGFTGDVYSENVGVPSVTTSIGSYSGWQNGLPVTYNALSTTTDVRTTSASSGYSGASAGGNIFLGSGARSFQVSGINTLGYTGLTLSFGLITSSVTNTLALEVSDDGVNYTPLSFTPVGTSWQLITASGTIPATANLRIRFSKNNTTQIRVDDIKISGTTNAATIGNSAPLAVCGSGSVYLSANTATGILWSTGATTKSILVNTSGTYTYTATGANGCASTSAPVTFTVNPEPLATATSGTILCNGGTTTVDVTGSNGTAPYTGAGSFTVSAGVYSYIVTDANGCDDTASVTINQPPVLTAAATPGIIACNGGTTTIDVAANGGTAPYTGEGSFTVSAGPYSYTVTDAVGCTATISGTVAEPALLVASATEGTILCNGGTTTVSVSATGGTTPYIGTGSFTVFAGNYSFTVTDAAGCTSVASGIIAQPSAVVVTATPGTISCNGGTTSVVVSASGGVGPYTGEGTFTASAGNYSYTVTDATGCAGTATGTISEPTLLVANATAGTIACNGGTTTVVVTASGGTAPYTGEGSFTVSAGPYSYMVTDAKGCTSSTSGSVTQPAALALSSFSPTSGNAGTSVIISGTGMTLVTAVKFGTLAASFTINSDLQITATVPAGAITSAITLESACGNVTSAGSFTVLASTVTLNLRVLLQGFYAGGGQMSSALLNQGVAGASATETDSVTVELHSATSPFATVYSKTGILDLDGDGTFVFPAGASGNSYYIVVLHRNHLQTWSKDPVTFGTSTTYDFSAVSAPRSSGQPSGGSTSTGSLNKH